MKSPKYELEYGSRFLRDLKLAKRRGLNMKDLSDVTDLLQEGKQLPERCRDHLLTGNYKGYRECHINPDWLLIYKKKRQSRLSRYIVQEHILTYSRNKSN